MAVELGELLRHDELTQEIEQRLSAAPGCCVRLTGPSGSGKTHIARAVASQWKAAGGRCVVAVGDETQSWRGLYPLLSGLSKAHRDWSGIATVGARSAVRAADAAGGGGAGASIFDAISGAFRERTERLLRPYGELERDVLLDLLRMARSRRVLLVADNAHWWDEESLRLLYGIASDSLREDLTRLRDVSILLVDTADEQLICAPAAFATLMETCGGRVSRTALCTREQYPRVLQALGQQGDLPEDVISELFTVTQGHLKLAEQIAASQAQTEAGGPESAVDAAYLSSLIAGRVSALGSANPEVSDLLVRAALFGLSCAEQDLQCVTDRSRSQLAGLLEHAERVGFLERAAEEVTFSHDVIRAAVLTGRSSSELAELYSKLASCLSTIRPGDYGARAQALERAGEGESARDMVALAAITQIRRGASFQDAVRNASEVATVDRDLATYLDLMAAGYAAVAAGEFEEILPELRTPPSHESPLMAAERNYVAAICLLGGQRRADAREAAASLRSWLDVAGDELELELRLLLLLQQAHVLSEEFDAARDVESRIEQKLAARSRFDRDAAAMLQVQNRRAGALMAPEVAARRIEAAVDYFGDERETSRRGRLELYRSLTNLSAIEIRLGRDERAYEHARRAERVVIDALEVAHRPDVLASNLVLAGQRSGQIDLGTAIEMQLAIVRGPGASEDNFLQTCNLAAYLLLATRDGEAQRELDGLEERLTRRAADETYLVYYCRALGVAAAALCGDIEEAQARHDTLGAFIETLRWPTAPYIRRRQQLLDEHLQRVAANSSRASADRTLLEAGPRQVGAAWSYYARLIPCCELSFWSDS